MKNKIIIGIAGFGNIGSYFYKTLQKNKSKIFLKTGKYPVIKYVSAKNFNKKRNVKIPKSKISPSDPTPKLDPTKGEAMGVKQKAEVEGTKLRTLLNELHSDEEQ